MKLELPVDSLRRAPAGSLVHAHSDLAKSSRRNRLGIGKNGRSSAA